MTRREFVRRALATAGVITGAPALLRGQNLNSKLNIAFIACGGRASCELERTLVVPGAVVTAAAGFRRRGAAVELPMGRRHRIRTKTSSLSVT